MAVLCKRHRANAHVKHGIMIQSMASHQPVYYAGAKHVPSILAVTQTAKRVGPNAGYDPGAH